MVKTVQRLVVILISFAVLLPRAFADDEITFKSTEVGKGIYMLEGVGGFAGGNIALSVGEDGVVMIDDSMPPLLDNLKTAISTVTQRPITFLINTHLHQDHTGNNVSFGEDGTHIIGHEKLRERLKETEIEGPEGKMPVPKKGLPVITFEKEITFYLNGEKARVFHLESAHTDGDAVIYFEKSDVLHTGDILFNGLFPFIDLENGGSVQGYIAAQQKLYELANDKTVIIPGHGPVATKADLKAEFEMLEDAMKRVAKLKKKGMSEDEVVAKNPLKKYDEDWSWGFINTEKMTRTVYQSI
ncbi:glyoxylase-like metal-dependent hydrolase (beta-lactamase superfamily II) [Alteromonadaceae bacterium 2753L.S.0a.02]|nr:glyoxylase-like metal-dependent hydrolase (beta-lactamase superfamily II) [Alteromonadaceae bacterium 2753L.S.0a.02]